MKLRATEAEKHTAAVSEAVEKTKAAEAQKQAALITEAVEKAKADMSTGADSSSKDDLEKRHAEQLRSLEEKLKAQYDIELKAKVDSAVAEALKAQPTPADPPARNSADQQAAIDAALEQFKKEIETRHAEEIASAVERGRMEAAAKGKLKDSQLVKAQKRVKELEAQIQEWKAAGIVLPAPTASAASPVATAPGSAAPPTAARPAAPSTTQPVAGPSQAKPVPATAATAAAAAANQNAGNLPRKPPAGPTGAGVAPVRGGAVRQLGRGGVPLGVARGGAPLRTAPVKPPQQAPLSGGVSIVGAAAKRAREEGSPADDSLAKRLKPAEPLSRPVPVRKPPGAE